MNSVWLLVTLTLIHLSDFGYSNTPPPPPLKMRMNVYHSHLAAKMMKIAASERFGQYIRRLMLGRNVDYFDQTLLQFLSN